MVNNVVEDERNGVQVIEWPSSRVGCFGARGITRWCLHGALVPRRFMLVVHINY